MKKLKKLTAKELLQKHTDKKKKKSDGGTIDPRHKQSIPSGDLNQFGGRGARKPYSIRMA